jgi:hypothetical protein
MKTRRLICLLSLFLGSAFFFLLMEDAGAVVTDLGTICFILQDPAKSGPLLLQLGALSTGTDSFPVHGKVVLEGSQLATPVHGTALTDGTGKISMALNGSDWSAFGSISSTYTLTVDSSTLTGSYHRISLIFSGPAPFTSETVSGSLSVRTCP